MSWRVSRSLLPQKEHESGFGDRPNMPPTFSPACRIRAAFNRYLSPANKVCKGAPSPGPNPPLPGTTTFHFNCLGRDCNSTAPKKKRAAYGNSSS
jgi:hypothetical protein